MSPGLDSTQAWTQIWGPALEDQPGAFVLPSQSFLSWLVINCMQHFFGSKRCLGGNTQAHPQTVQTVHFHEGRTPFCTVCTQWRGNTLAQINVRVLYSFFAVYQQTNKCTAVKSSNGIGNVAAETVPIWKLVSGLNLKC